MFIKPFPVSNSLLSQNPFGARETYHLRVSPSGVSIYLETDETPQFLFSALSQGGSRRSGLPLIRGWMDTDVES